MAKKKRKAANVAATATKRAADAARPAVKAVRKAANESEVFFFKGLNGTDKTMEKLMNQNKAQIEKFSADAASMGRESMDAFMKSSTLFAKGMEQIMRTATTMAQSAAEKQGAFFKEALSSKTLNEWTEVQNKMAQSNFDDFMSSATQISEMSVKLMTEAVEPISEQMTKAMQKASAAA